MAARKAATAAKSSRPVKSRVEKAIIRPRRGAPEHVRDPKIASIVELCKAIGYSIEQTARVAAIAKETLLKHYADEWEKGEDRVNAKIAGNLASIASDRTHPRSVVAAIFWMKTRAKWNDGNSITIKRGDASDLPEGSEDEPVVFSIRIGEKKEGANG
jgi:hypothetical protein